MSAGALGRAARVSQPLLTWHLHRLKRAGIVRATRNGREVICALDRERFAELQRLGYRVLMNPAEARVGG